MAKIAEQSHRALPKNLIHPLPVQDPKGERFRRPALPFAGARRRSDGEDYGGGAAARGGKTLTQIRSSYEFPNLGDSTYSDLWFSFSKREVVRI